MQLIKTIFSLQDNNQDLKIEVKFCMLQYVIFDVKIYIIISVKFLLLNKVLLLKKVFQQFLVWTHEISLALSLFIEVLVPSQEYERSCICTLEVCILTLLLRFFDRIFRTAPTMWYLFFILFYI